MTKKTHDALFYAGLLLAILSLWAALIWFLRPLISLTPFEEIAKPWLIRHQAGELCEAGDCQAGAQLYLDYVDDLLTEPPRSPRPSVIRQWDALRALDRLEGAFGQEMSEEQQRLALYWRVYASTGFGMPDGMLLADAPLKQLAAQMSVAVDEVGASGAGDVSQLDFLVLHARVLAAVPDAWAAHRIALRLELHRRLDADLDKSHFWRDSADEHYAMLLHRRRQELKDSEELDRAVELSIKSLEWRDAPKDWIWRILHLEAAAKSELLRANVEADPARAAKAVELFRQNLAERIAAEGKGLHEAFPRTSSAENPYQIDESRQALAEALINQAILEYCGACVDEAVDLLREDTPLGRVALLEEERLFALVVAQLLRQIHDPEAAFASRNGLAERIERAPRSKLDERADIYAEAVSLILLNSNLLEERDLVTKLENALDEAALDYADAGLHGARLDVQKLNYRLIAFQRMVETMQVRAPRE